jgi:hypothetical protein
LTILLHYKVPRDQIKQVSCLKKVDGEEGIQGSTFTHWHDITYRYRMSIDKLSVSSPKIYKHISEEEFLHIINKAPCIFARKFNKDTKVVLWNEDQISLIEFLKKENVI